MHEEHGGTTAVVPIEGAPAELATRVVAALPQPAMYARIDLLYTDGGWHVLEVEATEPSLWLPLAPPDATARLADAVMARLAN